MAAFVPALLQSRHQAGRKRIQGCAELYINTKPQKVRCLSSLSTNRYRFTPFPLKKEQKGRITESQGRYLILFDDMLWIVMVCLFGIPPFLSHIATPILAYPRQSSPVKWTQSSRSNMPQVGWRADSWVWTLRSPTHGVARYLAAKGMLGVFHAGTKAGSASAWNWMNQNRSKIAANPENCSTAPKIHMEPENGPLQFEIPCWKSSFSGFMLKFQECT